MVTQPAVMVAGMAATAMGLLFVAAAWRWPAIAAWRRRSDERGYHAALPEALEAIARSLRSGASLFMAIQEAVASGPPGAVTNDLSAVADDAELHGLAQGLEMWRTRRPRRDVRRAAAVLALAAEVGGAQAQAIDAVAAGLRQRRATEAEMRAMSAQARLSALVIACAPVGFALLNSAAGGDSITLLFGSTTGWAFAAAGVGLDCLGLWWMLRLTAVPP